MQEYYDLLQQCDEMRERLEGKDRLPKQGPGSGKDLRRALDLAKQRLRELEEEMLDDLIKGD